MKKKSIPYTQKRPTVGQSLTNAIQSNERLHPVDVAHANQQAYLDQLMLTILHAQKKVPCSKTCKKEICDKNMAFEGDIFIEASIKLEKALTFRDKQGNIIGGTIRNQFFCRKECPHPFYNNTVWRWNHKDQVIEHLWSIPDPETCAMYIENRNKVVPAEYALLNDILRFKDGTWKRMADTFNNVEKFRDVGAIILTDK